MPQCTRPIHIWKNLISRKEDFPEGIYVRCGKCLACKQTRAIDKAVRVLHEAETYGENENKYKMYFMTFTYDDENIYRKNGKLSLNKNWIRKVRDRIYSRMYRKYYKKGKKDRTLINYKYMIAGEYGESGTNRPHYHMILLTRGHHNEIKQQWINELKGGRIDIQQGTTASIFYVAKYTAKKLGDDKKDEDIEDPFIICSKGLGKEWCLRHSEELKGREYMIVPTKAGVFHKAIFDIYLQWLIRAKKWTEEEVEDLKRRKREFINEKEEEIINKVVVEEYERVTKRPFRREITERVEWNRGIEQRDENTTIYLNYFEAKSNRWRNTLYEEYKFKINRAKAKLLYKKMLQAKERRGQKIC